MRVSCVAGTLGRATVMIPSLVSTVLAVQASTVRAEPTFVLVSTDGRSLLTAKLQGGKAVITDTQPLAGIGGSFSR